MANKYTVPTPRKRHASGVRREVFKRDQGHCYICLQIVTREWEIEHPIPLEEGGSDDPKDLRLVCKKCHGDKTAQENSERAYDRRVFDKTHGVKKKTGRPMAGSKASGLKKTFDRRVFDRKTGLPVER